MGTQTRYIYNKIEFRSENLTLSLESILIVIIALVVMALGVCVMKGDNLQRLTKHPFFSKFMSEFNEEAIGQKLQYEVLKTYQQEQARS